MGEHEHFCPIRKVFQRTFVLLFKMATMNDQVCKQFGSEVVVMLLFLQPQTNKQKSFCRKHCLGQLTQNIEHNWVIIITCMDRQEIVMNK